MRHLARLLRYDVWANRETLDSLKQSAPPRSLRWLAHIVGAEYLWMARLRRQHEALPVWPELDAEACGERLDELSRLWPEYFDDALESLEERGRSPRMSGPAMAFPPTPITSTRCDKD